jgi:hypothetical protein
MAFGSAAGLTIAGAICAVFVGGLTGEVLAIALITIGLGAGLLLIFLEVGLSEDHALARDEERRRRRLPAEVHRRPRPSRRTRRRG